MRCEWKETGRVRYRLLRDDGDVINMPNLHNKTWIVDATEASLFLQNFSMHATNTFSHSPQK